MFDVRQIIRVMGGDVTGRNKCVVPGPNHSPHDRSLSIRVRPDGFDVYSFAGDDWQTCRDYVLSKLGFSGDWKPDNKKSPPAKTGDDQARRTKLALEIWNESIDPRGTLVETYLRDFRGLKLANEVANSAMRFHAQLKYDSKYLPAMVCLMRDIKSDAPVGIHRTFLDRYDGRKIDRRMLGIAKRAAVKFDAVASSLILGEGVETVASAREAGFKPAWAVGSAGAIGAFPVLRNVRELTLLLENDPTSERFVWVCLHRYRDAGRTVKVIQSNIGSDFNDCWRAMIK